MSIHPRNSNTNRYPLFKQLFDTTSENTVLDFGGNTGNLLHFSQGEIHADNYTSVDVSADSITQGATEFPSASFVHYDRWNSMYNHAGEKDFNFPTLDKHQDFIYSFSVFTHTDFDEFLNTLRWLHTFNYTRMAHSLLDLRCTGTMNWFYNKRVADYGSCADIMSLVNDPDVNIVYLYDNHTIVVNEEIAPAIDSEHFLTFYDTDWLINRLDEFNLKIKRPSPDLHPFVVMDKEI